MSDTPVSMAHAESIFESSDSIAQLAAALSKAQGAMEGAAKDTTNPFFRCTYADLASNWAAVRKPLADNELSVVQVPGVPRYLPIEQVTGWDDKAKKEVTKTIHPCEVVLHSRLLHSSGEWIGGTLSMRSDQSTPQAIGSALTYARRYALAALVGIAPEDDDGEGAMDRGKGTQQPAGKSTSPRDTGHKPPPSQPECPAITTRKSIADAAGNFAWLHKINEWVEGMITTNAFTDDVANELRGLLNQQLLPLVPKQISKATAEQCDPLEKWIVKQGFGEADTLRLLGILEEHQQVLEPPPQDTPQGTPPTDT